MAATVIGLVGFLSSPAAQEPSLELVLERAAAYVEGFQLQLSGIVAEETYFQHVSHLRTDGSSSTTLRSDLILVKPSDVDRYVELRDVYEAGGHRIRERESRIEKMLHTPGEARRIDAILAQSARYNIGSVDRNINTPLMTLLFLTPDYQRRFRFSRAAKPAPVFTDARDGELNRAPTFRVNSEMWEISYQERGGNTIIRQPNRNRLPARGRFWINPVDGSVLISELLLNGGGVNATITVSYQTEPLMGFLVPIAMHESYLTQTQRITGRAEYGRFRPLRK